MRLGESGEPAGALGRPVRNPKAENAEESCAFGDQGNIVTVHCLQMLPSDRRQETIQCRCFEHLLHAKT